MFGEYGYTEEGKLGKPYNLRLLKRLVRDALPYRKTIVAALLLSLCLTLCDLAIPYLSKIAIDDYIRASWYRVNMHGPGDNGPAGVKDRYGPVLLRSRDTRFLFISHADLGKTDPAELHRLRTRGILGSERYYRIRRPLPAVLADRLAGHTVGLSDGSMMVPCDFLSRLPDRDIRKIRAADITGVSLVAGVAMILIALSFALRYAEHYLLEFAGQHIMRDIRLKLFRRVQAHAVSFFDRNPVGRLVTRLTNDVENLNEMFKSVIVTLMKDFFILIGILGIMLYMNLRLALVCVALVPVIFGITLLFSTMARDVFRELRAAVARINTFLQERITGMQIIQLFVRETHHMDIFSRLNHENYLAGMKQVRIFAVFMPIMEFISSFAVALLIWYGGSAVRGEAVSLGTLVAFISYIQMFFKPIRDISEKYNIMQSAMASMERIFEYMDHREEIPEPESPQLPPSIQGHIVFEKVSFAYRKGRPVLKDVSFEVKPGETVAVVGATGAGKTTIVNLLGRLYDPDDGAIYLDGVDLRNWPTGVLRSVVSLCMQDVFIFSGRVADNISLGRETVSDRDVERAAAGANALPRIQKLENGFLQELGERGATLSAGERQLLSFARALASDPRVLVLDEATSSVDPETERLIQEAILQMAAKRTTLIVAHRLSTIEDADRILVMHRGRIREQGTHEELLAQGGIYHKLQALSRTAS